MISFLNSALDLRRRSVWEAADSGVLLWRKNFVYFIPFFAVPVWFAASGLRFLPDDYGYLSYAVIWWLKPLFDRLVLQVISIRFFDPSACGKKLRRGIPRLLLRGLLGDILWRRFSPGRAAYMPIRVLERPDRKLYRLRKKSLASGGLGFCFLVSAVCLVLEGVLLLGEIMFASSVIRMFFPSALAYLRYNSEIIETAIFAAYCLNYILVESLYVCTGFGLYINSRVEVEGWDLQLLFQKFVKEEPARTLPGTKTILLVFLLFAHFFAAPPAALYGDSGEETERSYEELQPFLKDFLEQGEKEPYEYFPENFPVPPEASVEALDEILSSKDFGSTRETWGIRFRERKDEEEPPDTDYSSLAEILEKIREFFGHLLRVLVILAAAGFLGLVLYRFAVYRKNLKRDKLYGGRSFGNPLLSTESPESLFAKAEACFGRGELRDAWAACLSGCIGAFTRDHALSFPAGATEYDCLELAGRSLPKKTENFGALVNNWVFLAYGGRTPAEGAFENALAFGRSLLDGAREA